MRISDVTPEVFQLVLEFAYSGSLRLLAAKWLKAANAELLFEAAEWFLMPLFKVGGISVMGTALLCGVVLPALHCLLQVNRGMLQAVHSLASNRL